MLKECCTVELEDLMKQYPDAVFYRTCRMPIFIKGVKNGSVMAPNKELHGAYQDKEISFSEYYINYYEQIYANEKAIKFMKKIKIESEKKDVYLVCVCKREKGTECHRFIIKDMITNYESL